MSTTSRMGHGLAFGPDKDLAMFADMARRGHHLDGVSKLGHGWSFTEGPPEQAVFDLAYEIDPSSDYFEIFRAAGWTPVLSLAEVHIFKAAPGTPPVHAGTDSRREELTRNRDRYLRHSVVASIAFLLVGLVVWASSWNQLVELVILVIFLVPVVYTVIPLIGYWRRLDRIDRPD